MRHMSWCLLILGTMCCLEATAKDVEVPLGEIPAAVTQAVKANYPQGKITAAEKETEDGKTVYDVSVVNGATEIELSLQSDGTILKVEQDEENADDESEDDDKELKQNSKEADDNADDEPEDDDDDWTSSFAVEKSDLVSSGRNPFFVLEPGYQLVLQDEDAKLVITVLDETKMVDGVEARIVEERESEDGELIEVSRNFFAISKRTNAVFYFGEEVDIYEGGQIVKHEGAWLAGEKGAKFGLAMPGLPLVGAKYYQEYAEGVAMDRAEIDDLDETLETPVDEFKHCLKVEETNPLKPKEKEYKIYAPGVGLLQDESLKLVQYGKVALPTKP